MWVYVLLVTVISFVPGEVDIHVQTKVLNVFKTPEECKSEQIRITKDMELSYPGHTDFRIACEKHQQTTAPVPKERIF